MLRTRTNTMTQTLDEVDDGSLPAWSATPAPVARLIFPSSVHPIASRRPVSLLSPRTWSFLIVVLLPVAVGAIYFLAIAADQYVAEFRMTLRRGGAPQIGPLLPFGGDSGQSTAASESQIVTQFIASRAIVDELEPALD